MDKITSFQIKRLEVSGFKCFAGPVAFDFGEITNILGSNHVGKSSIADAIAFAITGTTYWGESRIDRLYSEAAPGIEITLDFEDQNGAAHQLVRRRKNDKMAVTLDSYKVTQSQLNGLFGDRDTFLSIFNPLYFIEVLQDEGKKLLESVLPPVKHETVRAGYCLPRGSPGSLVGASGLPGGPAEKGRLTYGEVHRDPHPLRRPAVRHPAG